MNVKGFGVLSAVFCAAFFLSTSIDDFYHPPESMATDTIPAAMRIFGESRNIVSSLAFLQADLYFHRGVEHLIEEHETRVTDKDVTAGGLAKKPDKIVPPGELYLDPLSRIATELEINEHDHIGTEKIQEIIPWLYYAQKVDPNNITVYTVTAYYLADRFGKVDEAVTLLKTGMANNPDSWEICAEMGNVLYQKRQDYSGTVRFMERALFLMGKVSHDRFDERNVLTPLAYSYLELGKESEAFEVFGRISALFPESASANSKVKELQARLESTKIENDIYLSS